jgi:hypothetical protein
MISDEALRQRMVKMAEALLEATKQGKITWALTPVETKFIYAGSRSSVTIELASGQYDEDITILSLLNQQGTIVDSLETEFIKRSGDRYDPAEWNSKLEELYHAARRFAHNVDDALESMLSDIERGTPSPPSKKQKAEDPWAAEPDEPPF